MVKNKIYAGKKSVLKGSNSDGAVPVCTSLPPKINGQLRCYLTVKVCQITWLVPNAPHITHVRVLFWGEEGKGSLFRPEDGRPETKALSCTIARYGVRSGPKQFVEYLNDMGTLVFEVLSSEKMIPVGRAQVNSIGTLTASKPIAGSFPVLSADSEKVADLKVIISIEPIMNPYETASSVPTPDHDLEFYARANFDTPPINAPRVIPAPDNYDSVVLAEEDMLHYPVAQLLNSGRSTPSGVDAQLFAGSDKRTTAANLFQSPNLKAASSFPSATSSKATQRKRSTSPKNRSNPGLRPSQILSVGGKAMTLSQGPGSPARKADTQILKPAKHEKLMLRATTKDRGRLLEGQKSRKDPEKQNADGVDTKDLLTTLITKGSKLRNEMIISAFDPSISSKEDSPFSGGFGGNPSLDVLHGPFDALSKNLLTSEPEPSDVENEVLDILFDPDAGLKGVSDLVSSPVLSLSEDDRRIVLSDSDNPLHDTDLLDDLLYKSDSDEEIELLKIKAISPIRRRSRSHSISSANSLNDAGNVRPPSRRSSASGSGRNTPVVPPQPRDQRSPKSSRRKSRKSVKGRSRKRSKGTELRRKQEESDSDATNVSMRSEGSRVSFDPTPSDSEVNSVVSVKGRRSRSREVDGLSIQRYALLGRIEKARVTVSSLVLCDDMDNSAAGKNKGKAGVRGKPPTPNNIKQRLTKTYYVEYQFPVAATSRDRNNPNAMATEVVKVVSKKIVGKVITFDGLSAFPILFDADAVEKWWKSALLLKLYCRTGNEKMIGGHETFLTAGQITERMMSVGLIASLFNNCNPEWKVNLLGMCSLPLKSVLKAKALCLNETLEVKDRSQGQASAQSGNGQELEWPSVGQLKVSVELATDTRELQTALAKAQLAELKGTKVIPVVKSPIKRRSSSVEEKNQDPGKVAASQASTSHHSSSETQTEALTTEARSFPLNQLPIDLTRQNYPVSALQSVLTPHQTAFNYADAVENVALHALLLVPEGINITLAAQPSPSSLGNNLMRHLSNMIPVGDFSAHNIYIVSRMFLSDDACRSNVCWGTSNPKFDFVQMSAFLLTQSFLERMKNNFMIIEVYVKKSSSQTDQLIGIVKLPLHQFYMSYRDRRIATTFLTYPSPVVAVDGEIEIINLFTQTHHGHLKVFLAMGSFEQITNLQRNRAGNASAISFGSQQVHQLERIHMNAVGVLPAQYRQMDNFVDHLFEVAIEGITGLKLSGNMMLGEADCFIQYYFPTQTTSDHLGTSAIQNGPTTLKSFCTSTTLCVQDPSFHHLTRHRITLPEDSHVQKEILAACSGVGGGAGGVLFELWFRCYSPNTREQVFAKALLPLAKLCAMVTMKKQGERSVQSFSLTLTRFQSDEHNAVQDDPSAPSGLLQCGSLDVTVNYETKIIKKILHEGSLPSVKSLSGGSVCISVSISKACGLKTAAIALAKHDNMMKYPSEVGVNSYIRVRLSFLTTEDERLSRTVARSFAPDFSCAMDFPCPLLWTKPGSDAVSLAEILENGEAVFEVWHQLHGTKPDSSTLLSSSGPIFGHHLVQPPSDVLLGFARVPLKTLLVCRSGISGWQPIHCASIGWDTDAAVSGGSSGNLKSSVGNLNQIVGGLEVKVSFAHDNDLDSVFDAAYVIGWSPSDDGGWGPGCNYGDESFERFNSVTVSVDDLCFPLTNALFAGQSKLDTAASCYIKYRFYDKKAAVSKISPVEIKDGFVRVSIKHSKTHTVHGSSVFFSYLREEQLEIEVMMTYSLEDGERHSRNQDRKIGSAFIGLLSLCYARDRQHRIRSTFPLFKAGSPSLGGACLTADVTIKPCSASSWNQSDEDNESFLKTGRNRMSTSPVRRSDLKNDSVTPDLEKVFPVHVSIERAFRLPMVMENQIGVEPCAYVSYQTAEQTDLTYTEIVRDTINPVWCHEHDTFLSRDLLSHKEKLIFKVWHKSKDVEQIPNKSVDRVLGFVSVDLSCLKSFGSICGCYNVIDVKGVCRGQLQVSIVPTQAVMSSNMADLELTQIALATSTVFVPGNTIWCSKTHGRTSSVLPFSMNTVEGKDQPKKFHNSQIQHVFDSLRNVDARILSLSKPRLASPDEPTAPESDAMPLSTSSLLMTYGSTTFGTNTWGALQAAIQEGKAGGTGIIDIEANDMRTLTVGDGLTSAESTTKGTMAQLLQQTLENTGSTVVSFAAGDSREPDTTYRSNVATHGDIGSDFSATLRNAQMLLEQFKPILNQTDDAFDNTPLTIKANDQENISDRLEVEDPESQFSSRQFEADALYNNHVEFNGNHVDDNLISDFEEEDTFSNIWAMRSSQRRSSERSFDSTVEPAAESAFVEPRVLNDISAVKDMGSTEPKETMSMKQTSENIANSAAEEISNEEVSSDTMFVDSREFEIAEIDIENKSDSQNHSTLKTNELKSHSDQTSGSQKSVNTNNNSSKIHQAISHNGHKAVHECKSQTRNRSWKAAMHRRELRNEECSASSESDEDETNHRLISRPPSKVQTTRSKALRNTASSVITSVVSAGGNGVLSSDHDRTNSVIGNQASSSVAVDAAKLLGNPREQEIEDMQPKSLQDRTLVQNSTPISQEAANADKLLDTKITRSKTLPNFFLPPSELAKSMQQIRGVITMDSDILRPPLNSDDEVEKAKSEAANEILQKFNSFKAASAKRIAARAKDNLPTTETLKRIAKIFDGKLKT